MWNLIKAVLLALLLLPVPGLCWAQEQPITITPGQAAKWTSDLQQLQQELTQLESSSNEKSQSYRDLLSRYNQMSEIVSKLQNKLEIAEQKLEEINRILDRENAAVNELDSRETADREAIRRSKQIVDRILRELQEKTGSN